MENSFRWRSRIYRIRRFTNYRREGPAANYRTPGSRGDLYFQYIKIRSFSGPERVYESKDESAVWWVFCYNSAIWK